MQNKYDKLKQSTDNFKKREIWGENLKNHIN
jgi:hypothetical protein